MQALIADRLEKAADICRQHHVKRLALFGSAACEDFDPKRSDVDLLVKFGPKGEVGYLVNIYSLKDSLARLPGKEIDLMIERPFRNPVFRRIIQQQLPPFSRGSVHCWSRRGTTMSKTNDE